jgi:hypothetical protein
MKTRRPGVPINRFKIQVIYPGGFRTEVENSRSNLTIEETLSSVEKFCAETRATLARLADLKARQAAEP